MMLVKGFYGFRVEGINYSFSTVCTNKSNANFLLHSSFCSASEGM